MSKSDSIGVVGGIEDVPAVKKFVLGYEPAPRHRSPKSTLCRSISELHRRAARRRGGALHIAEGADVIFGAGGQTGSGGIQAAAADGVWVIGVDQDEFVTTFGGGSAAGADKIVSSAMKRVDNAVFDAIKSVVDGNFSNEPIEVASRTAASTTPSATTPALPSPTKIKATVEEVKAGLGDGSIKTDVTLP